METLSDLIEIPSVSGDEMAIANYIADRSSNTHSKVYTLGANVAVHIPGSDSDKAFIINGHIDTVPPTDDWTIDPFKLTQKDYNSDIYFGLGVSDMKSGISVMMDMGLELQLMKQRPDVWMLFSSNEETNSSGSLQIVNWLKQNKLDPYHKIGGVILEPTNSSFVGIGHRGDTVWDVISRGPGGHASREYFDGTPSIEKISKFIAALPGIREQWKVDFTDAIQESPTVNVTSFNSASANNVVPVTAGAKLNLRITSSMVNELDSIRRRLEKDHDLELTQAWQPVPTTCDSSEYIFQAAKLAMPDLPFSSFPGVTDQFAFQSLQIPMLIYGPGEIDAMHQPDEWVRGSSINECLYKLRAMFEEFSKL